MAFPVDHSYAKTETTAGTSSHNILMPTGVAAGDTLVALIRYSTEQGFSGTSTGLCNTAKWVRLVDGSQGDGANDRNYVLYAKADGSETGTITTPLTGASRIACIVRCIKDAADPTVTPPELTTEVSSTTFNPTNLTPSGGAQDYLWLYLATAQGEPTPWPPATPPTNYSTNWDGATTGTGGTTSGNCCVAAGSRQLNAASEDMPSLGSGGAVSGLSWAMAVYPVAEEVIAVPGYQRIYGPTQLATSASTLYTVPTGARLRIRRIWANNPSGSPVDFTFSVGTDSAATRLYDSFNVPANDTLEWSYDHALTAGERIQAFAGTASTLVLVVDGFIEVH